MSESIKEAEISLSEGGVPIGAVIVKDNEIISRGHNRLIQNNSVIFHAEMDAIENAKDLTYEDYRRCTDNATLMGAENLLKDNDVEVIVLNDSRCKELFDRFVKENPGVWEKELAKVGNTTELK